MNIIHFLILQVWICMMLQFSNDLNHIYDFHLYPKMKCLIICYIVIGRKKQYQFINILLIKYQNVTLKCAIFERYNITKYDNDYFEQHKSTLFAIKPYLIDTEIEKNEIDLQKRWINVM